MNGRDAFRLDREGYEERNFNDEDTEKMSFSCYNQRGGIV